MSDAKSKITLVMIVKNEAKTLPRLLKSLKPHISAAVIHDTGSTDNTLDVLLENLQDIPHRIRTVEWRSFGENRSDVIKDAGTDGYLIIADADFEYFIQEGALDKLTHDGYLVPMSEDSMVYSLVTIVKAGIDWEYVGRTHEYLNHVGKSVGSLNYDSIHIKHHHDGGARSDKFERDLALLQQDYSEDPNNYRTVFYLAQTHECLGNNKEAIELYEQRFNMGGWDEEAYIAKLRAGRLKDDLTTLLEAWSFRKNRLEALYEVAIRLRSAPEAVISLLKDRAYDELSNDLLFVEKYIWDFGIKFELAQAYYKIGRINKAENIFRDILEAGLPDAYKDFITTNYPVMVKQ